MPSQKYKRWLILIGVCLLLTLLFSAFIGRYPSPYWMPPWRLLHDNIAQQLVINLRLPRLMVALLLGASLSACGTVMQMIFRNPLVEPGFLGVSQGAAFGAALSILFFSRATFTIEIIATFFGMLGLFFSYYFSRRIHFGGWILRLVLAGIAVSALFSAGIGVLKYLADPLTELPDITFWMLGGLWSVTWRDLLYVLPLVLPGLVIAYLMRWRLNLLSLDDETAFSLGSTPSRERTLLLTAVVSATAAITSISGIVGWIGLIIPHISRRIFGVNGQYSLPGSMILGAIFSILCDNIARSLIAGEIPLGILSSFFGALLFLFLMMRMNFVKKQ